MEDMVWVIVSFIAGLAVGVLTVRIFAPILVTKYKIVEKIVRKSE